MGESTSEALDFLRADRVPAVVLEPHVDADAQVVMAAADHVAELLPHASSGASVPGVGRRGFSVREHLDELTFEQMKALMKAAR